MKFLIAASAWNIMLNERIRWNRIADLLLFKYLLKYLLYFLYYKLHFAFFHPFLDFT